MATSRVTHTVENLEAGQRDSIRRADAKAAGEKKEVYDNLPSDAELNAARAEERAARAEASEPSESESGTSSGSESRRGPSPTASKSEEG